VVERMIVLDHLSGGRALFGIGRGLALREYERFGVDMNEARDRFDEAAELIFRGLETGIVEGEGPYYKQRRTEIRPRPYASFKDRFYAVGMSSDSVPVVARLGAKMMSFAQKPWEEMTDHFNRYRDLYRENHNTQPPSPVCVDFLSCDESAELAELNARKYMANYYITVMEHYEMTGEHFRKMKGYGDYADNAELLRDSGMADAANAFVDINTFGTPPQILDKMDQRRKDIGDFDLTVQVSYGGLTGDQAETSIRLFADEVLTRITRIIVAIIEPCGAALFLGFEVGVACLWRVWDADCPRACLRYLSRLGLFRRQPPGCLMRVARRKKRLSAEAARITQTDPLQLAEETWNGETGGDCRGWRFRPRHGMGIESASRAL